MVMENEMFGEDEIEDTTKTFLGVSFILLGFDPLRKQDIELKLFDGGATDAVNYGPHCTHVIVDKLIYDDPMCITARRDGKMLVTGLWVDHSFDVGMSLDPNAIIYRPLRDLNGIPGAESMTICLTGYHGPERADIMTMVGLMGATFSKPLVSQKVTHLICYKFEGEKYDVAKKLKIIKLVNHFWLIECLKAWAILPEADYAKSAYELEMETEVKDSEDETEDTTPIIAAGRKSIMTPQNTRIVNKISNQLPMKPEIPRNSSYSTPCKLMADVDGNRNVQSTLKKKTDSGKRSYSRNKQEVSRSVLYSSPSTLLLDTGDDRNIKSTHSKRSDHDALSLPEKQEIPRNCSNSGPSNHFVDSSKVQSSPRKETDPEMASNLRDKLKQSSSSKLFLNKLNNCDNKIQSTPVKGNIESLSWDNNDRQTETPRNSGKISSKTPSNMVDGGVVCERAENLLPSASESAKKKSPRSEVSKRSSGGLLRSTPRKPSLSPNSERIASNLGGRPSPSTTADKLHLASGNSNLPSEETHQNGTDFQGKRPLKRTITNLQLDEDKTAFTSDKRKKTLSLGSTKFRRERESGIEPKDLLASEFSRDGSLRLSSGQISPARKGHLSCEGPSEPSEIRVASNKDEQECNWEVLKSYQKGLKKRSLALNVEVNENSVSRIGNSNREVEIHQRGTNQSFEPPFLNTSIPREEASNQNTDLNFSKSENVVPPLKRKMLAKKTLGSRPSVGKVSTSNTKGSIGLKKATEDSINISNDDDGMTEAVNINKNKSETNKLHESFQGVIDEDETEAPDDKVDEIDGEVNADKFAEVEPQDVGNLSLDDVVGLDDIGKQGKSVEDENGNEAEIAVSCKKSDLVKSKSTGAAKGKTLPKAKKRPSTITKKRDSQPEKETEAPDDKVYEIDGEVNVDKFAEVEQQDVGNLSSDDVVGLDDIGKQGISVEDENGNEAEIAVSCKKSDLVKSKSTGAAKGKTLPKAKKRPSTITKKRDNQPEKGKSKREEKKTLGDNELRGESEARLSKKLKRSTDAEKENEPGTITHQNLSNVTGAAEKSTKKLKKSTSKILKVDKGYSGSTNLVVHDKIEKNEPACFILSGHRLQRKEFQQVIKRLKGKVCRDSHSWSYQATHLIVPDPIKRTEKFFAAAASGSWILKVDYLTASNEAGKLLSEEPYEWHKKGLSEDGAINLEAPRKWRLLRERTGHGAFYGMRIVIYGECIAPPLETLKRVIKAGGGTILATSPPYTRFFQSGIDFAVVSPSMLRVDIWVQEFLRHEVPCVLADYLVEYVCKPSYSLDRHVQYGTHSWAEKSLKSLISRVEEIPEDIPRTPEANETDDVACQVCGSRDRGDEMLICGDESGALGCGIGTHLGCLEPPLNDVPEDDWFCKSCRMKEVRISVGKSLGKRSSKSKSKSKSKK